ncbi:hypothetical protein MNBD_GAMMA08-1534 [hydrothermal vent metagenome]|uniref:Uncharacterized protein n=1 Tax=hydrothermal vent metagenome TaxID=652676 RepID=A0A3B0WWA4_9ZZZZ
MLSSASQDLIDGYHFYEQQANSAGSYFLDSLVLRHRFLSYYCECPPEIF